MNALKPNAQPETNGASNVLIAEDEVLVRMVIADFLRRCGFTVVEVSNGAEALSVLQSDVAVDVVFSDVNMPGDVDGFALARWMRAHRPGVPVILTSGVTRKIAEAGTLCEQEGSLLPKPYDLPEVERRIRTLLANHQEAG